MASTPYQTLPGSPHPLGATPDSEGVNFSLYAGRATAVTLLLFEGDDEATPAQVIQLDQLLHSTFMVWHVYVVGLRPGARYAYRVDGPRDLHGQGDRYDPTKILIDPYARAQSTARWQRAAACGPGDNLDRAMRSVVVEASGYDWEGDKPLRRPIQDTIIYELHVGGFTRSPSAGCRRPGTFAALVEKIPYLQELGVTAVELLPVCQFDPQEIDRTSPVDGRSLTNFWGYSTLAFFSPHNAYCTDAEHTGHLREFRDMVKALHRAGIEVILDIAFNHSGEGDEHGPTLSFKGLDNSAYYFLEPTDRARYLQYSGCGNTVSCNHPLVAKLILDCLDFWVREMHVDGFRFDEAAILSRGEDGAPLPHPPVIWAIALAETLADTKVIAEAWDAGGLNQVGYFPGLRWAEWNGRYRDEIRRFVRGDPGLVGAVASRISGSADLFQARRELPTNSVNFVTCHDGFTLADLVSYDSKHNEANGEGNRDGSDQNLSWNCGAEGPTDDPAIEALRARQIRNFAAILLLSQGVPMLLAGDEVARTQGGNNNAYCQDNETSWFDWELVERRRDLLRFFQGLIAFRKRHRCLRRTRFFSGSQNSRGLEDIAWHGCLLVRPGWDDPNSRVLAFTLAGEAGEADLHVLLNMEQQDLAFELPTLHGEARAWYRAIDTALPAPDDIAAPGAEQRVKGGTYLAHGRSVVVLISAPPSGSGRHAPAGVTV